MMPMPCLVAAAVRSLDTHIAIAGVPVYSESEATDFILDLGPHPGWDTLQTTLARIKRMSPA